LIVFSELSLTDQLEVVLAVVVFGKSVGAAESGLTLAFVPSDAYLLGAFITFVSFLLNWLGFFFDNFDRLDLSDERLFVDGDFMTD